MLFAARKKHVLVIDDDLSLQRILQFRLSQLHKLKVSVATSGLDGLELARQQLPDLILLDWVLPDISGTDVLEQLKQTPDTAGIAIVMLTGRNLLGDVEQAFALGADGYMTKPISMSKLSGKINALLLQPAV